MLNAYLIFARWLKSRESIILICLFSSATMAAQKFEREHRVSKDDFPEAAMVYLKYHYPEVSKFKLYHEFSNRGESFEAKFRYDEHRLSVEFGTNGMLQDIEKRINRSEMDTSAWQNISNHLQTEFRKWRIKKIQAQTSSLGLRYEIELLGWVRRHRMKYQFLFSDEGTYISHEEIIDYSPRFDFY